MAETAAVWAANRAHRMVSAGGARVNSATLLTASFEVRPMRALTGFAKPGPPGRIGKLHTYDALFFKFVLGACRAASTGAIGCESQE